MRDADAVVRIVDLERASFDYAAYDLGSFVAQRLRDPVDDAAVSAMEDELGELLAGYDRVRGVPSPASVRACVAASALAHSLDPFRRHEHGWDQRIRARLDGVERLVAHT